ncbi:cell division cycle protein [Achlya hypogyna]|uniref:Cell division cycle protein n=1 Tax=Achlya hypogyna TaxID=1202772 RepID=A0A1V9ZJW2_ACHHY|nr:cell division cycle protein [Achlya hypogyna]
MAVAYTVAQVDRCRFTHWYPHLAAASIRSVAIELPEVVVQALLADKIQFREADYPESFVLEVKEAVRALGGSVLAKLDWSCPKDAKWILGNSLACRSLEDMVLALKASDFVLHDLTRAYDGCVDREADGRSRPERFHLVLKKWCNFFDSMHFRCFVRDACLVGISQRNCGDFYPFLADEATQDVLCEAIGAFYERHLAADAPVDPSFVFDVYVDKSHRVFLLDINVYGPVTDALLFSWDELAAWEPSDNVDFRVVASPTGVVADSYSQYKVPVDLVDHLAAPGGFDAFMRQVAQDNAAASSDSDIDDAPDDDDADWGSD